MKNPKQQIKIRKLVALHEQIVNDDKKINNKKYNGDSDVLDFICNSLEIRDLGFADPIIIGYIHD